MLCVRHEVQGWVLERPGAFPLSTRIATVLSLSERVKVLRLSYDKVCPGLKLLSARQLSWCYAAWSTIAETVI